MTARNVCELLFKIHGNDFSYIGLDLFEESDENKDEVIPKATRYGQFTHSLSQIALTYLFEIMTDKDILIYSCLNIRKVFSYSELLKVA